MKLLFSEAETDYARYRYSYVIWAVPEPGETPALFFQRGFLPGSPRLDRYYLCRNLRVDLGRYRPSSENRRILRKGGGIEVELVPRAAYDYSAERREEWLQFAAARFGPHIMPRERLDALMAGPVISHVLRFWEGATGREVGAALLLLEEPQVAYYYYAFYDLAGLARSLGMFMMTRAVDWFAQRGFAHLHLGTCYSERALYKTQFAGVQFFNGFRWSDDLEELRFLLGRHPAGAHLLESTGYRDRFYTGPVADLAQAGGVRLAGDQA